jgi:uncharacterized protein involved in copper resistance
MKSILQHYELGLFFLFIYLFIHIICCFYNHHNSLLFIYSASDPTVFAADFLSTKKTSLMPIKEQQDQQPQQYESDTSHISHTTNNSNTNSSSDDLHLPKKLTTTNTTTAVNTNNHHRSRTKHKSSTSSSTIPILQLQSQGFKDSKLESILNSLWNKMVRKKQIIKLI